MLYGPNFKWKIYEKCLKKEKCSSGEYKCKRSAFCIKVSAICDKIIHCPYRDDELNCFNFKPHGNFQCSNNSFFIENWKVSNIFQIVLKEKMSLTAKLFNVQKIVHVQKIPP